MNSEISNQLIKERNELLQKIMSLESELKDVPQGRLRVLKAKGKYCQYYVYSRDAKTNELKGEYIRRENIDLAKRLAQRDYYEEVLKEMREKLTVISQVINTYGIEEDKKSVYERLNENRKKLVTPIEISDEDYITKWYKSKQTGGNTYEAMGNKSTERGETVRSKSEKILADKLYHYNVPYVYEPTLLLPDGNIVYPDFVTLNVRLRKEYYWEHFGIMDNPQYAERAIWKIDVYEKNGFWCGKNILYTFETDKRMPDDHNIDEMINLYLK